jgi:2'-5' RNA ligase
MKKHRIFLAINLPEPIKKKLLGFQREWADLPVRWTKPANLHITLFFIGYVTDQEMLEICQLTRQIVQKHEPFEIKLERICLGPPKRPPRMIWAEGQRNEALSKLKNDLGEIGGNDYPIFRPHITLARDLKTRPKINKEISLSFLVNSVEVMESHLSRGGAEYAVLESVPLGE